MPKTDATIIESWTQNKKSVHNLEQFKNNLQHGFAHFTSYIESVVILQFGFINMRLKFDVLLVNWICMANEYQVVEKGADKV